MEIQHNFLKKITSEHLTKAIKSLFPEQDISQDFIYGQLVIAPEIELGHYAFPCFPLAKVCRTAPPQIAKKIEAALLDLKEFEEVKATGPYLNIKISLDLWNSLINEIMSGDFFNKKLVQDPPKMMIEYSQPNTHKVLHVGHMRNLCLGNALVRLNRYINENVLGVTYPGDSGAHVAKCLWYLKYHSEIPYDQLEGTNVEKGSWLGNIYTKATLKLEEEKGSSKEEENRKELTEILRQLEAKSGLFYEMWLETRQWSLDLMKKSYDWADVEFDRWFFESEVDSDSLKLMKDYFNQGLLIKDQNAIGMNLKDDNLGFCLLVKSDGTGLYSTKDIELARRKFEDFKIEKNVYIVDNRQALHFKQVFKVLERLGFSHAKDCFHLPYEVVELPDGPMSSRKGNIIPLMNLINLMEEKITSDYLEKYRGQWEDLEIKKVATEVANGAIKYGMIRMDNNRKIIFNMDEWLKLDGETGPYLQYVHARIFSLCQKNNFDINDKFDTTLLKEDQEKRLLVHLNYFNDVIVQSAQNLKTMAPCSYLYELGKYFNSFYVSCPIAKAETLELKKARLALSYCVGKVMKQGLELLGIPAPEKM